MFFFFCVCLFLSVQAPLCQEVGGCEFKREPLSHCVPVFVPLADTQVCFVPARAQGLRHWSVRCV